MSVLAQNAQERQEGSQDSLASNSDADKSGICQEDDGYRFYICGTAVTTPGWTSSDGYEVYVDRDGYVAKVYNLQDNKLELYIGSEWTTHREVYKIWRYHKAVWRQHRQWQLANVYQHMEKC